MRSITSLAPMAGAAPFSPPAGAPHAASAAPAGAAPAPSTLRRVIGCPVLDVMAIPPVFSASANCVVGCNQLSRTLAGEAVPRMGTRGRGVAAHQCAGTDYCLCPVGRPAGARKVDA